MARNKELLRVQQDIQAQSMKLKKLKNEEKRLLEADNIRLGKLVRDVFGDLLPDDTDVQVVFFQHLRQYVEQEELTGPKETVVEPDVSAQSQTINSGVIQNGGVNQYG